MVALHDLKQPPNEPQLAFIDLSRRIQEGSHPSQEEINKVVSNQLLREMATALSECEDETDFWKIWDALVGNAIQIRRISRKEEPFKWND
jgi:hypothetical protein